MVTTVLSAPPTPLEPAPSAVPTSVITGSLLLTAGCCVPLVAELPRDGTPAGVALPLIAWLALGIAGVVLLDRRPRSPIAWACVTAAATPMVVMCAGYLWPGGEHGEPQMPRFAAEWGPLTLAALVLPILAATVPQARSRGDRRWRVWIVATCVGALGVACLTWFAATAESYGICAAAGIGVVALVVATSGFVAEPRPVIEPLVDIALAASGIAVAAGAGGVVLAVARHEQIFGPEALGAFATAATLALNIPAAWWLRREFLTRRYGTGVLSADEIAALTADLKTAADPRALLTKAGAMVTATSGVGETRLLLDDVAAPDGWVRWPLLVGDELVGTMLLLPSHPGGLEARQTRVCRQLLPTVALVARAVTLAIDAEYARHDVAHQRDLERSRILADLHDDLGPVLAGMSMRVQAALEAHHLPELDDLADDLAACRADLRRIVSGLAPVALHEGDLDAAITHLVESFNDGVTRVTLTTEVPDRVDTDRAVLVYRAIAEGITNAIKHAHPAQVSIGFDDGPDGLRVSVTDDGIGGAVVPGVGLQSLRGRAAEVGGTLSIEPMLPTGTRLLLTLPSVAR
ncbi:hypothetical protein GCM10027599_20280 [Yimella radicis]